MEDRTNESSHSPEDGGDATAGEKSAPEAGSNARGSTRSVSDAKLAANRRNAQRSTGPRTDEGKQRSSQNALKHGIYAEGLNPITGGPLREDNESVESILAGVVDGLAPATPLEIREAVNIAKLYLRLERLDRLETNLIEGASTFSAEDKKALGDEELHWQDNLLTHDIEHAITCETGCDEDTELDFYAMTAFLQEYSLRDDDLISSRDPWFPEAGPVDESDAKRLFEAIVNHFWPDGGLESRLVPIRRHTLAKHIEARGRLTLNASHQALAALDRTTRLRDRIAGQLLKAVATYMAYRAVE